MAIIQGVSKENKNLEQLTDEELIERYRDGINEAIEVLVQRYKRFVRTKIKANYFIGVDKDDLIQEGMIGLFKAICDYDAHKDTSFKSFATLCVTRQVSTAFKAVSRQKHIPLNTSISLSIPINHKGNEEDDEGITLLDTIKNNTSMTPEDEMISKENLEVLNNQIIKALSKLEWQVLNLYISGKNYQEIAKEIDKSPKSIDNALQRIKKKLESVCK